MTSQADFPVKEFDIPVPWGHVSGKIWGEKDDTPVVMAHGFRDNCCSFDNLIPYLPSVGFKYITFDLPGNGKSSKISQGLPLNFTDYIFCMDLIFDELDLKKFHLIGHSLGAQLIVLYSNLYPEKVTNIILIDGVLYKSQKPDEMLLQMRKRFDHTKNILKNVEKSKSYGYDFILNTLMKKRQLNMTTAKSFINRSLEKTSDGFHFNSDPRFKVSFSPLIDRHFLINLYVNFKCPILIIFTEFTIKSMDQKGMANVISNLEKINLKPVIIEGNHDVHLNNPEKIASVIKSFMFQEQSHL